MSATSFTNMAGSIFHSVYLCVCACVCVAIDVSSGKNTMTLGKSGQEGWLDAWSDLTMCHLHW